MAKQKLSKRISYRIQYSFFLFFLFLAKITPKRLMVGFGSLFGLLVYKLGIRKDVVALNLKVAFPEKSREERIQICRDCYKNVGRNLMEFFVLNSIRPDTIGEYITLEGGEELEAEVEKGKCCVVAFSHFGNWELLASSISTLIHPIQGYTGKYKNLLIETKANQIRGNFKTFAITKSKDSPREMVKILKQKGIFSIMSDFNVPRRNLFVDFFGVPASSGTGLGQLVSRNKAPLFFVSVVREGPFRHKGMIKRLEYDLSGEPQKDIHNITELYSKELEKVIQANPDHYFWLNRRWKTRPEEEEDGFFHQYNKLD